MFKRTLLALGFIALGGFAHAGEVPQSATLQFKGSYGIPATMSFKRTGNRYTTQAQVNVPLYKIQFESGGTIAGNELKPEYFKDTRNGKLYASAEFQNGQATYGRADDKQTEKITGRVMDLFTLSWQLAFSDGKLPPNLKVTNGKRLYPIKGFQPAGSKTMKISGKETPINQFHVKRGDDTVVYAFAPQLNNVPAFINYHDGNSSYKLELKSAHINGAPLTPQ